MCHMCGRLVGGGTSFSTSDGDLRQKHTCVRKRVSFQRLSLRPAGTYYLHLWPQWDHRCPDAFSP